MYVQQQTVLTLKHLCRWSLVTQCSTLSGQEILWRPPMARSLLLCTLETYYAKYRAFLLHIKSRLLLGPWKHCLHASAALTVTLTLTLVQDFKSSSKFVWLQNFGVTSTIGNWTFFAWWSTAQARHTVAKITFAVQISPQNHNRSTAW